MSAEVWQIPGSLGKKLLNQNYSWDENGLRFQFMDESEESRIDVCFSVDVEYFKARFIELEVSYEDDIYQIVKRAGCSGPINPFFILTDSNLIDEVINRPFFELNNRKFKHYIMITDDLWIDVVSSKEPRVEFQKISKEK